MLRAEVSDGDAVITLWGRRARAAVRRGAPRCALKTLLLRAVITLWGRGAARTRHGVPITSLSYLFDPAAENMEMCGEISFLRCICIYIIIMQYHTNRGCTVVDQVSMLDRHSSGLRFKSRTWLKFDSRFQPCVFPQASSAIMSTRSVGREPGISIDWPDHTEKPPLVK